MLPHIIQRQVFDLHLRGSHMGDDVPGRVRDAFYKCLPKLEALFSYYDDPEHIIRLGRISLDLGKFGTDDIEACFPDRLCEALSEVLKEKINSRTITDELSRVGIPSTADALPPPDVLNDKLHRYTQEAAETDAAYLTTQEGIAQAFLYFLVHGNLPWWTGENMDEKIESIFANVLDPPVETLALRLKQLLAKDRNALKRLSYQFPVAFIEKILLLFENTAGGEILSMYHHFMRLLTSVYRPVFSPISSIDHILQWLRVEILLSETALKGVDALVHHMNLLARVDDRLVDRIHETIAKDITLPYRKEMLKGILHTDSDGRRQVIFGMDDRTMQREPVQSADEPDAAGPERAMYQSVYVNHAGLVILHPFLPAIFSTLRLLDNRQRFRGEKARTRAVHLLAFLATGKPDRPENTLGFCKFLCGMPLNLAIGRMPALSIKERRECTQLLQAVIDHWTVLKHTSVEGLREAFLSRNGKLDFRDAVPALFIERMTYDILLDSLPWGIGYIQLPWVKKPVAITWN